MLFVDLLTELNKRVDPARNKALKMVGDELLRLSNKEVPFDKGTLSNSGRVDGYPLTPKDTVEVGYHTRYAHRLHEHPEYNFKNGRKGKYLEDPIKHNLTRLSEIVGYEMGGGIIK
jgi:hypothetical protein